MKSAGYDTIRYDTRCCFNVQSKADTSQLNLEKSKKNKKNGYAQKHRNTVRGIRGVSPGEENEGYGWNDLQKRKGIVKIPNVEL